MCITDKIKSSLNGVKRELSTHDIDLDPTYILKSLPECGVLVGTPVVK